MNCVAIPPTEDKHPPIQILHNELTLTPIQCGGNKSQSLQRAQTTHLYCRSLEKERVDRRTSRGLTSCLRGERDEFLDYRDVGPQQLQIEPPLPYMESSHNGSFSGNEAGGRSEYKSKTLPRIHFDNSVNDTSLNEGNNILMAFLI
ncbi:uncharacterized protein LOC119666692 [Teleopsis dalmanni]|uniref:uncharacterized protein LOC119666692 n=1 Tax=Teleopsis dalmanni TaxID=139649 RepID=UPI0018CF7861|nr:uncharacterized protein LOC119666692 [Teleopsis dalmanni]